ncbi:MAG: DUF2953 domain-containing protein [Clostridiaceae bacterium]|nr:DUF2953 domain-containing protein [Clostridiaceae bacterium]
MWYVLIPVLVIALMLYLMPIAVSMDVNKDNDNDKITIGLRTLYGLLNLKTEVPFLKIAFENGRFALKYKVEVVGRKRNKLLAKVTKLMSMEEGEGLYDTYKNNKYKIMPFSKYIKKKIGIRNFNLKLSMGTGDAAATGFLYGILWIVIGNLMTFARSHLSINEPRIMVVPIFSQVQLSIDFSCIISMKLGHIINAGIRTMPALLSGMRK